MEHSKKEEKNSEEKDQQHEKQSYQCSQSCLIENSWWNDSSEKLMNPWQAHLKIIPKRLRLVKD